MVVPRRTSSALRSLPTYQIHRKKHRKALAALAVIASAAAVISHIGKYCDEKHPMHTSILTGQMWMDELFQGI